MKNFIYVFFLISSMLIFNQKINAQQGRNDEIIKAVTDYFFLERENIHAQFDKNVFMTNESIWFKGYVFHRKKNTPFFTTVNIYASLMDSEGKIIETKLLYGNIGCFAGGFKLGSSFKSGKYYIQFYTNWMNNFIEDESAVYEIAIVNHETGSGNALAKADPSKINIELNPEGGTLLRDINNNIGIHVTDCNHNALPVTSADIIDGSGKTVKTVQLNKLGYGKFDLPSSGNSSDYKAIVTIDDRKYEQQFPQVQLKGIALEVNNYAVADKTIIKVKTNKTTINSYGTKPLYMLIHQDDKATSIELTLNDKNLEQTIVIPNTDIANGMNTIRILDSDLIQLAERMFFKYPEAMLNAELNAGTTSADKLQYKGKINYPNMNISITVLPENTISFDDTNDIYGSFMLLPYLETQKKASGRHYFTTLSKGKMYELDLYLMSQKSKYKWNNILQNPPKNNYTFDMGVTLKGTIPGTTDTKFGRVRLYSLTSGIDEITEVNDKREFYFKNLIIPDSSYVNFTLLKKGSQPKELTLAPQILNVSRTFNKPYKPEPQHYLTLSNETPFENPNIFMEFTQLEEVKIEGSALKYANSFGNGDLHGYKITDDKASMYFTLLNFIKTYGSFWIDEHDGQLKIYSRTINTINGAQSGPIIYVDNVQLLDYELLKIIYMSDVDEIYMNAHTIIPSVRNYMGMIKIYLKKGARPNGKGSSTPEIIVKKGFEKIMPFQNVTYNSVDDKGFENFGIVDWKPLIMTNENGEFKFTIPKMSSKPLKVLIEGFSADGKLISEVKTINTK